MFKQKLKRRVFKLWYSISLLVLLALLYHHKTEYEAELQLQTDVFVEESQQFSERLSSRLEANLRISSILSQVLTASVEKNIAVMNPSDTIKIPEDIVLLNRELLASISAGFDIVSIDEEIRSQTSDKVLFEADNKKLIPLLEFTNYKDTFQALLYEKELNVLRYYTFTRLTSATSKNTYSVLHFDKQTQLDSILHNGEVFVFNTIGEAYYYSNGRFESINFELEDGHHLLKDWLVSSANYSSKPNYLFNASTVEMKGRSFLQVPLLGQGYYYPIEIDVPSTRSKILFLQPADKALQTINSEFWEAAYQVIIYLAFCMGVSIFIYYFFKLDEQAAIDPLTELYNRKHFSRYAQHLIELHDREKISAIGIVLIDIDKFKVVNDTYGHDIGDKVLQNLSHLMQSICRSSDTIFRLGGEEFCIICVGEPLDGIVKFAERLRQAVERQEAVKQYVPSGYTISLGVSIRNQGEAFDYVVKRADELLYKAKEGGRNQVQSAWQL